MVSLALFQTRQILNWLRQLLKTETAGKQPIEEWCKEFEANDRLTLRVLSPYHISGQDVRVFFSNNAMVHRSLLRYEEERMHLCVDGKHKVNDRGWIVLTVNILIKDFPRWTHLSHGKQKSVQGKATTTGAMPVLQAYCKVDGAEHCGSISVSRPAVVCAERNPAPTAQPRDAGSQRTSRTQSRQLARRSSH